MCKGNVVLRSHLRLLSDCGRSEYEIGRMVRSLSFLCTRDWGRNLDILRIYINSGKNNVASPVRNNQHSCEFSLHYSSRAFIHVCARSNKQRVEQKFFPIVVVDQTPDRTYVIWPFPYFFFFWKHVIQEYVFAFFLFDFNIIVIMTKPLQTVFFTGSSSA